MGVPSSASEVLRPQNVFRGDAKGSHLIAIGLHLICQLWKATLPGNYRGYLEQIYSQPLLYTLDDGIQYAFIATTQNNVYKINAKTGTIVAQRNLHIPFLTQELIPCLDINPTVGVIVSLGTDHQLLVSTDSWVYRPQESLTLELIPGT